MYQSHETAKRALERKSLLKTHAKVLELEKRIENLEDLNGKIFEYVNGVLRIKTTKDN